MASMSISVSLYRACSGNHVILKKQSRARARARCSFETKKETHVVVDADDKRSVDIKQKENGGVRISGLKDVKGDSMLEVDTVSSVPGFRDERWKNGNWDLNMFVKDGKMDWDALIIAEARRRKFLEIYPEAATNETPVLFRSSIIPWWAWMKLYLPEAELLNGRAAMVGFFMVYAIDALTGLDMVGQTGHFIWKAGLFMTVTGISILGCTKDFGNLKKLAEEATSYDKQWRATWQDQNASNGNLEHNQKSK
ncbi:PREDICTED: uncharacterized protein LOC104606369 [Nelumbo nucifera]|uniref:Uncharacterized protein LOC104606369 n=1 Tax=Nelumbo nucifera TaxID=4432 RepID=A0A1U8B1L0_NELNU|nr:PREDICTED: uncharacterized protein LOC104606369 [Nelumbo nucifera]